MRKFCGVILGLVVVSVMGGLMFNPEPVMAQTEQITLTTYYPSPFGVYRQLRARQMAIGPTWANPAAAPFDTNGICLSNEFCGGDFFVEGNVGIGTKRPTARLQVQGAVGNEGSITISGTSQLGTNETFSALYLADSQNSGALNSWYIAHKNLPGDPRFNNFEIGIHRTWPTNQSAFLLIDDVTGNVGIGVGNPQAKLDIAGKARSQSTVDADVATTLTTKDYVDFRTTAQNVAVPTAELTRHHANCVATDGIGTASELMSCIAACHRICSDGCDGAVTPLPQLCNGGDSNLPWRYGTLVEVHDTLGALCACQF